MNFICCIFLFFLSLFTSLSYADNRKDLQSLRQSISFQEKQLSEQKKQRIKLITDIKKQEIAIANSLNQLEESRQSINQLNKEISNLTLTIKGLEKDQLEQKKKLTKQIEGAFKLGKTSGIEQIFSAKESAKSERILSYYRYINEQRKIKIEKLKRIEEQLDQQKLILTKKQQKQQILLTKQKSQQDYLILNQKAHKKTVEELDQSMIKNKQKLFDLRENESLLQKQIVKAEKDNKRIADEEQRVASRIKDKQKNSSYDLTKDEKLLISRTSGIGKPNHNLNWPVKGRLLHPFGEPLEGELYWKGMVIDAREGTKVNAIADGRVILANWLQGYGFIVALDHGKGDMTLYGYNQRVLVNVGDKVVKGQNIALVGTSGGQNKPALYFEIRRDGRPLDPRMWLKT